MKTIFKALFLINLLLGVSSLNAQNFEWARSFGSTGDDRGQSVCIDDWGNIYTTGYFTNSVDFDSGEGITTLSSLGGNDVFVQKMDASGNFLWAKSFGGATADDFGRAISVDASGNVYVTGRFQGTVDFDPGTGTNNLTSVGNYDTFVQKLDAFGNFIWAKAFGGLYYDFGCSIQIDASGNVYTAGYFSGVVDFDPSQGTVSITSTESWDIFVQKMDAAGNFLWAKSFGRGIYDDFGCSISLDGSGNVYATGYFLFTADFDSGAGTMNLTSVGDFDVFVLKIDAEGGFLWAKSFGGASYDYAYSNVVDDLGNIYTIGRFQGTADFEPGVEMTNHTASGGYDIFVQKMDSFGNFLWAKSFGGIAYDEGRSINVDLLGNIYLTGYFAGTVDFHPGTEIVNLTAAGINDIFVLKMDSSGNFLWAKAYGSMNYDGGLSIDIDMLGNVYTTGYFRDTADFDFGSAVVNLTSIGGDDIFVHKISQTSTGILESGRAIQAIVYPNPSQGNVEITLGSTMQDIELMLTDIQGRVIFTRNYPSLFKTNIELPNAKGVYVLKLKAQDSTSALRLVKE